MTASTMLERAFQLAKGGEARAIEDVARRLKAEGYSQVDSHLAGPSLRKQLKGMMAAAQRTD